MKDRIRQVLNDHDPMGLIAMDCPEDEYASEAASIAEKFYDGINLQKLSDICFRVFYDSFTYDRVDARRKSLIPDTEPVRERYQRIAEAVLLLSDQRSSAHPSK